MEIKIFKALTTNYIYLVRCEETNKIFVVDPSDCTPVIKYFEQNNNYNLNAILITHHHADHTGGVSDLVRRYNCKVFGHNKEKSKIPKVSGLVEDDFNFKVGNIEIKVVFVPGHTLGHVAYLAENNLFSGDTLFNFGCGKIFEGTYEMMLNSLKKLKALPDETNLYCAHEYTLNGLSFAKSLEEDNEILDEEMKIAKAKLDKGEFSVPESLIKQKKLNPFFRFDDENFVAKIISRYKNVKNSELSIFSHVRILKDNF